MYRVRSKREEFIFVRVLHAVYRSYVCFFISIKTRQLTAKSRPVRDFVRSCAIPFRKTIYGDLIHLSFIRIQSDDKDFSFKAICIRII